MTPDINIRAAKTRAELEEIYRFRYGVYVEEMRRKQLYAEHDRRRIEDPLDNTAINLAAWRGNEIIGVIRNNAAADGPLGIYESFYEMKTVAGPDHPALTSITTRLMVSEAHRKSSIALRLALASYDIGLRRGTRWNFIDCNDHLVRFFKSLGWQEYVDPAEHPEYGLVHRLRLDLRDIQYLEHVQSPFCRRYREHQIWNGSPTVLAPPARHATSGAVHDLMALEKLRAPGEDVSAIPTTFPTLLPPVSVE